MQFSSFEDFWAALGRLSDEILAMKDSIEKLRRARQENGEAIRAQGEFIHELTEASQRLLSAAEKLHGIVESHERPLDRTEITVEAILEGLHRHCEQRPSQ